MDYGFYELRHLPRTAFFPAILTIAGVIAVVCSVLCLTFYVFHSLGVYTLAKRRQIRHAWLSWIPLADTWVLGSLSDQYQYMTRQKVCTKRWSLLGIHGAAAAMWIPMALAGGMLTVRILDMIPWEVIEQLLQGKEVSFPMPDLKMLLVPVCILAGEGILKGILSLAAYICRQIVYYHIYSSCEPDTASVFLILGICLPMCIPFLLFANRKKDNGARSQESKPGLNF